MPRVKRSVHARKKRRKVLDEAKGYWGLKSRSYRYAKEQVEHSLVYAYRDRKNKKRTFRQLWIVRINAAARAQRDLVQPVRHGLHKAGIELDRKVLADLAVTDPAAFTAVVEQAKAALEVRHGRVALPDHLGVEPDAEARAQAPRAEAQARGARALRRRGRGSRRGGARSGIEPIELLVAGENVEPDLLAGVSTLPHPARVVGVYRTAALPREPRETTLALWRIADPGNVGTLLRAADAFGAAVALSEGCADPLGSKALRASAGAIFRVPLLAFDDAPGTRVSLVAHGAQAAARARPFRPVDVRPRRRARGAARRDRCCQQLCRHDRDERRCRVAQRRRRRRDRALRALAPELRDVTGTRLETTRLELRDGVTEPARRLADDGSAPRSRERRAACSARCSA